MWAAANDGSNVRRRRHRLRHEMRRRDTRGGDYEDGIRKHHNDAAYTKSAGSDSNGGSSSSDDDGDERSTTESIPDENEAAGQSTATLTAAGITTTAPQPPPPPPAVLTGSENDSSNQPQINPQPQDDSINIKKRKLTTKRDRKQKKKKKLQQQKQNQKQKAQLREEIPEATLARLTSSYSVAMEAVGALHRVSRQYCHYWREREAAAAASTVTQNTEVVTNSGHVVVDGDDDNDDDAASSKEKNAVIEIAKEARNLVGNANDKDNTNNDEIMATDESLSKNEDIKTKETNVAMDLEKEDTAAAAAAPPQPTAPIKTQQQEEINNDLIDEKLQKYHTTILTVAHAARTALEHSLLLDPVILAPILIGKGAGSNSTSSTEKSTSRNGSNGGMNNANRRTGIATKSNSSSVVTNNGYFNQHDYYLSSSSSTMDSSRFTSAWQSVWDCKNTSTTTNNPAMEKNSIATAATATCLMKWNRLSAAHHTVVTQIAYLSLVNYADLLLCGCTCHRLTGATSAAGISNCGGGDVGYTSLDRGAVTNLEAIAFFPSKKVIKTQSTQSCNNAASSVQYETENPSQSNDDFNSHHSSCCLWSNESRERTIRLALASYCDASELDPSDPTLWFKLACAARALGREVDSSSSPSTATTTPSALLSKRQTIQTRSNGPPKSYRCLERLALERGMSSLPPGVPPNRMLMRAWREMEEWDRLLVHVDEDGEGHEMESDKVFCAVEEEDVALPATATPPEDNNGRIQLVIHLPKYSWLTLGRILLRACREGAAYGRSLPVLSHVWSTNCKFPEDYEFGSPLVDIQISPILCLPYSALGSICDYLGGATKSFICTCRVMSSEVASARAKMEEEQSHQAVPPIISEAEKDLVAEGAPSGKEIDGPYARETGENKDVANSHCADTKAGDKSKKQETKSSRRGITNREAYKRVSNRVLSKMMTSEKRTERKAKQSSVEYCLLAGVLSCTSENPYYDMLLKADFIWEDLPVLEKLIQKSPSALRAERTKSQLPTRAIQANTILAPSSLRTFAKTWSRNNSGPRPFLESFLVHVSFHCTEIFIHEKNETFASCITDCFDVVTSDAGRRMESMPAWYGEGSFEDVHGDVKLALQILYVNLLNAELRFKRCESHDIGSASQEFQDEASRLAFLVPNLLQFVSAMSRSHVTFDESRFLELSTRCYWLASLYYFWWGRCCTDSSVANAADEFGMEYLSNALRSLSQCSPVITPHLGDQWSILSFDLLSKYQQKIQSSSVVTKARQSFHDIQHYVEERPETDKNKIALSEDVKVMLASLGAKLLERYSIGDENFDDKLDELLNDFILVHQDHLLEVQVKSHSFLETSSTYDWGESCWGTTWISVPSNKVASILNITSKETSRPSIMKVLSTSLLASEENVSSVFSIYAQIVLRALELRAQALQNGVNDGQQIDIDDFFQQSVTTRDGDSSEPPKAERSGKEYLLMITAIFFIDKLKDLVISYACSTDMQNIIKEFSSGDMLCRIICNSLNSSKSPHFSSSVPIFRSISKLVSAFNAQQVLTKQTACVYFVCLVKVFLYQRKDFGYMLGSVIDKRLKKWQLHLNAKADFISFVASEIADLMSLHPSRVNPDGELEVSHLVKGIIGLSEEESPCLISATITPFAQFTEALIWFWKICSNDPSSPENSRLLVPISSSIIALCGSPGISVECDLAKSLLEPNGKNVKINVSFSDYFDSEDSINGTFLSDEDTNDHEDGYNGRRVILRKFNQLVQCISVVFSSINEKIACQEYQNQSSEHGPILPLVAVRTLSNMSDEIFMLFSDEKGVWSEQYPYGARSCGNMLDNVLCKSYRCIYGFNIVGQNPNTVDSSKFKAFIPESTTAAAQLFRCIRRLFHNNRRAPPTKALEAVAAALPPAEETDVSKAIRKFLFSAEKNCDLSRLNTPSAPRDFPEWVLSQVDTLNLSRKIDRNDLQIIRKGICHELAKGSIMKLDGQNLSSSDQGLSEETELTKSHELSLNKKFCAVLDDLCYNPENIEGWIVLSECLGFKADIICDRLVPIKEPYNSADFCLTPESKRKSLSTMTLDQLKKSQQDEFEESRKNWTPFIGEDLYVFMHYPWSTFSSLQACAKDIGSKLSKETANLEGCDTNTEYSCWKEIESKFERENYLEWVNAWAGMFVTALRTMRMRALLVARFLAKSKQGAMHPSEVSEDIGTALYSDLMASTVYGYPMHCMTRHEKRQIALCSKSYFKEAIQLSESDEYSCDSQTISWEVQFMVGKCYEKIATTLSEEMYGDGSSGRSYEANMTAAIRNYSAALIDAQKVEESSGGQDRTCVGGSSHGSTEVLYRLHASRFKVLLLAIRRANDERDFAELEAFRIASEAWFDDSNQSATTTGIRAKTWDVLADTISALAQCRIDVPLFHRAAYRIAQAFNWAPAFHDPDCNFSRGSMQAVPATKSYRIRGLDTGSCAESAAVVITSLFEKRRAQLCSVWVTTSSTPPPFEVLNDSVRKYDALRLKYINAYIDSMLICNRKDKVETLLTWATTSQQDLPSFYEASAAFRGGDPGKHTKQSLLQGLGFISIVKRRANNALAEMILNDLAKMKMNGVENEGKKLLTKNFKLSYTLFQRLNTSCEDVVRFMQSTRPVLEVAALCKCYVSVQAGYRINDSINFDDMDESSLCSLLKAAISNAKDKFQRESKLKIPK